MTYQVFYLFSADDTYVDGDTAIDMDIADIYSELFGRLEHDDDFLGLIDAKGTTLQMYFDVKEDRYWIEIPKPEENGSYGIKLSFDEITDLLKSLPEMFSLDAFPNFRFQAW